MATFNILDHQISFDEDFAKYLELYNKKYNWISEYKTKYNSFNMPVKNESDFLKFLDNFVDFMIGEFKHSADNILNILANFQILDRSLEDITSHCNSINNFNKILQSYKHDLQYLINKIEYNKVQAATEAANQVEGYYLNVISTSSWDIITNDLLNEWEAHKTEKRQQRRYNTMMAIQDISYSKVLNETYCTAQKGIYEKSMNCGISAIEEMFDYCISILILENKLNYNVKEYLQKEKANTILHNLQRVQNEDLRKEQLVIALQANPISKETHSQILNYLANDIKEYIDFIHFLKCEDTIFNICFEQYSSNYNKKKYLRIIKALDNNNIYLNKILNNINIDKNSDIIKDIDTFQKLFETLKIVFSENIDIISQKEKSIFKAIANKIEKKYNAIYNYDVENLDYKQLYDFLHDSRQLHTIKNLKKKRRSKRINLILGILFAIWILLLIVVGTPINEIITYGTIPFLVVYGIIRLIIWIIKKIYENIKNSENPQGTNNATVFFVIMFSIMLGIIIACCTM